MPDQSSPQPEHGLNVKQGTNLTRVELSCPHQHGLLYAAPAPRTWVCDESLMHVHALAGFLRDLTRLDDVRIREAMQRWGIYYRELPLADQPTEAGGQPASSEATQP